jgi:hypothetical protein
MIASGKNMDDPFRKLFELELEFQSLSKERDKLMELDDTEVTGFRLATLLARIARLEETITMLRGRSGRVTIAQR